MVTRARNHRTPLIIIELDPEILDAYVEILAFEALAVVTVDTSEAALRWITEEPVVK